jgi:hypothetical protein
MWGKKRKKIVTENSTKPQKRELPRLGEGSLGGLGNTNKIGKDKRGEGESGTQDAPHVE